MENEEKPWISVWFHPKQTIRSVVDKNPKKGLLWLASLYTFQYLLFTIGYSFRGPPLLAFIVALLVSPVLGLLWFYVFGWFLTFTGKWLKGHATPEQIRAAFAWSKVPTVINYPIWIILVIASGSIFFAYGLLFSILNLVVILISIWTLVLLVGMIAEVQKFSIGRAIVNCLLAVLIFSLFPLVISIVWSALSLIM